MTGSNRKAIYQNVEELRRTYLAPEKLREFVFDVDISHLKEGDKKALPKLLKAAYIIDAVFLIQDHPQSLKIKDMLTADSKKGDERAKTILEVFNMFNGPEGVTYDTNEVVPLFQGVKTRPKGGTVYSKNITAKDVEKYLKKHPGKEKEFYKINTAIRRSGKGFTAVPYEVLYHKHLKEASKLLDSAAIDVTDKNFSRFLRSRALALMTGNYFDSDVDWVRSTESDIDLIIGPLEQYRDAIMSTKAFYAGRVCVKNPEESEKVSKYIKYLQELEDRLPQDKKYAKDMSKINIPVTVVDTLYMTGDYQAKRPGITVGQTLPNDEEVLKKVGRKIFIYKNVLEGFKPDERVLNELVDPGWRKYYTSEGKVNAVVGHEVSHSLGPKETVLINGEKHVTVGDALGFWQGIIEELKSDLLSMYNVPYLVEKGLYTDVEAKEIMMEEALMRNIPFNKPNIEKDTHYTGTLMKFNYMLKNGGVKLENGKFSLDEKGVYDATTNMVKDLLSIQSSGDKSAAEAYVRKWGVWSDEAQYCSETLQKLGVKLYKIVRQPTAEKILKEV